MKKLKKIILFIIFTLTLTCMGACANSCKGSKNEPKPNYVALNVESYSMVIGDELILSMDYDFDETAKFEYSSSNESIATVDERGKVVAVNSGTAIVTVTYGNASDSCEITVDSGNALAYLTYDNLPSDGLLRLCVNDSVSIKPLVSFNGKIFDDVQVEYSISDASIGEVVNDRFTAKQIGETEIYVSATWRGLGGETLTKRLSIEVVNDVQLFLNQGAESALLLYTLDNEKISVVAGATENGEALANVELELLNGGEKYVEYDGDSIKSRGVAGETALVATCVDSQGQTWEKTFKVTVTQTVLNYDGVLTGFSAMDGDFIGETSLLKTLGGRVVKAEDANGKPLQVKNGKIYGVETSKTGLTKTKITAYSVNVGYVLTIEGYTGIIDEAEDLEWFGIKNNGYESDAGYIAGLYTTNDRGYTFLAQRQDGYYVLANDIDASDYTQPAGGEKVSNSISAISKLVEPLGGIGLTGTFDGQGHTIRGLTVQAHGLFGIIYRGTLKNVAFTELKSASSYGSTMAQWIINATIDNVYIQAESLTGNATGLLTGCLSGTTLRGCIFEYAKATSSQASYGSLSYMTGRERGASGFVLNSFNGVYVVSPMVLTNYLASTEPKHYTADASNCTGSTYNYSGIKRYDTQADFVSAGESFVAFDRNCWDKSGETPVWKTKDFIPVEKDEQEDEGSVGVGSFNPDWL